MVPPRSRDTTAWFVPWMISNSRGRTSTISTRANVGPSFRTTNFTATPRPASPRSRASARTPTRPRPAPGKSARRARTRTGGTAETTTCQLRNARPATKSPRHAAALVGGRHAVDRRVVRATFPASLEDLDLLFPRRIADVDLQQEAIDLGFRERIGPLVFDWILRGDHEERPVQRERLALQGRLPFLHRLEKGRLGLRRSAVDLVREEDGREDGTPSKDEFAGLAVEHVRPRDIRRQQVRRKLDAAEREAQARRERLRDQGLRQPRDVFDQEMAVAEDRPQDPFEDRTLADDHGLDRVEEIAADLPDRRDVHRHASIRVRTSRNSRTKPPRTRARWTHANRSSRSH